MCIIKLQTNRRNETYSVTVPRIVVDALNLEPGHELWLTGDTGVFRYYHVEMHESEKSSHKKMKLQFNKKNNTYSVLIPADLIDTFGYKPGQIFDFTSSPTCFQFSPFKNGLYLGVFKVRHAVNNLPSAKKEGVCDE